MIDLKAFIKDLGKQVTMENNMKLWKHLLPCAMAACSFSASMQAAVQGIEVQRDYSTTLEERETDTQALADFVRSKGQVSLKDKTASMVLSGNVRTEWDYAHSKSNGVRQRGKGTSRQFIPTMPKKTFHKPFSRNEYNIEANLVFDYRADRTWGRIQLQFSNSAGIRQRPEDVAQLTHKERRKHKNVMFGSGSLDNLALRKAYMGYNVFEEGTSRFDLELGRRRLIDVFDSKVQFHNYYDGITAKYANSFEGIMDFQAKLAGFVVDYTVNHYGWVGELDFLNLGDEGVDFKYSFIHWNKNGINRLDHHHPHGNRFNISQFTLAYNISPDWISYKSQLYGAYLFNHAAAKGKLTHGKREREAYYVGFRMGEIKRQNDWAFDLSYQWVQPQAVPESDVSGIGRDSPRGISMYRRADQGFANYKGYEFNGLYAITDNLTAELLFQRVHQCTARVGGKHRSYLFELAAIYAF